MPSDKQRPDPQKSLVGFVVGDVGYAVPISAVKEIINPVMLTELPHAPRSVVGVADHRGEVVPVVDLRIRFGLPAGGDASRSKWILVDVQGRTVGLVVDQVTEVFGTGGAELRKPPMLGGGEAERGILGVTSHEGRLTFVLEVDRFDTLTAPLEQAALVAAARAQP
jgi:purine-binding chemotaxis protein CheW